MDQIFEISIINDNKNKDLFNESNVHYSIPLYQREFAWKENEINQLLEDIEHFNNNHYYLGSLVVAENRDLNNGDINFEVIDGQQRLTTLYLLMINLGLKPTSKLTFECREKSNETFKALEKYEISDEISPTDFADNLDKETYDKNIIEGFKNISNYLHSKEKRKSFEENKQNFIKQLKKVIIYRIMVPKGTDFNKYFEIMNTRGEQLEQHDILKARLLSHLIDLGDDELHTYSEIWNAISDMDGYVQMHFSVKNRELIFGKENWNDWPKVTPLKNTKETTEERKIMDIIKLNNEGEIGYDENYSGKDATENRDRFESIISFPYFLLHTLKAFVHRYNIQLDEDCAISELLNDENLLTTFENVMNNGKWNGKPINFQKFSKMFIEHLLEMRYLFDKYILKRKRKNKDDRDGNWSLQEMVKCSSSQRPDYNNTNFIDRPNNYSSILMLQSCARVSFTSPKIMHWITNSLYFFVDKFLKNQIEEKQLNFYEFENNIENFIKENIKTNFFDVQELNDNKYFDIDGKERNNWGVNTPHIVLNYIDYLLWKENNDSKFTFEFRNTVEHWYPRHPDIKSYDDMTDNQGLNCLGNLCLLQRNDNSKLSNDCPTAKISNLGKKLETCSLKLRRMIDMIKSLKDPNNEWRNNICREHEKEMYELLERNIFE